MMEDDCAECIVQWDHGRVGHIDIWTGTSGAGLQACEQALIPDEPVTIEVNPPPGAPDRSTAALHTWWRLPGRRPIHRSSVVMLSNASVVAPVRAADCRAVRRDS